jgi:hypothetical protein
MPKMKLADWARENGISYLTANRHFHAGMIPNAQQLDSGTILVDVKDDSMEQGMTSSSQNDAISIFLKKTVEFSKNGSSVEDFAAFVISNFQLRLNGTSEGPRYSRQKPKSEDVQKHFQQFLPKGEKPKPNSFVMDSKAFDDINENATSTKVDIDQELVSQFTQAVETPDPPQGFVSTYNPVAASTPGAAAGSMSAEGVVTRSVDLNTTPQPINYTGSNNHAFSSSLTSMPTHTAMLSGMPGSTFTTAVVNSNYASGIDTACFVGNPSGVFYTNSLGGDTGLSAHLGVLGDFSEESDKTLESKTSARLGLSQPRSKRGRKPSKR